MPQQRGMPDEAQIRQFIRTIEREHDDRRVRAELVGRPMARALNGSPLPRFSYRLECGHIVQVHGAALPAKTRRMYCGDGCGRERSIVEQL